MPITLALAEFREYWRSFHMPFACDFTGTLDDVRALDYLDYEGLGYPSSDISGAALVWGNVVAKQFSMKWVLSYRNDLLLHDDSVNSRITVWPFARVLEVRERSIPQFGRYAWLLDRTIRDYLTYGDLADDVVAWCNGVISKWEQWGSPWS
jgi:hypothetical protein